MPVNTVHVRITGRVQGVGFRAWTEQRAGRLGLAGWVRNTSDGAVEAVFSGEAEAVTAMLDACRKGPQGARVDGVEDLGPVRVEAGPFRTLTNR